jgi:hypothetical protein
VVDNDFAGFINYWIPFELVAPEFDAHQLRALKETD